MTDDDTESGAEQAWDAGGYDDAFEYVHEYGQDVVALLDPQPGERVLDLGCGTGHLTARIGDAVADGPADGAPLVLGIDNSPAMISKARATYPDLDVAVADATALPTEAAVDAVFSNAALHWIDDRDAVAERAAGSAGRL